MNKSTRLNEAYCFVFKAKIVPPIKGKIRSQKKLITKEDALFSAANKFH